ncbi:hypothetical protein R1flu_023821 [Riccia fluitans]|uniref:Uncharacterized protein n=1 Tax=Riccia fluitans TaxID=41844 RepID=A0ABD1XT76_9MARC
MEGEEGITKAEGEVPELEAGNMDGEEGVTEIEGGIREAEAKNMEVEEGVTEVEAGNMEAEEGVTEANGGVMEVDLEEATEAEGGITEPHLEEAADHDEGIMEAKEVAREMELLPTTRRVEHESHVIDDFHADGDHDTLSNTLAVGDVFVVKADNEKMEDWLLRCIARKHKITKKEVRCLRNTEHIFTRDEVVVYARSSELGASAPLLYFVKLFTWLLPEPLNSV